MHDGSAAPRGDAHASPSPRRPVPSGVLMLAHRFPPSGGAGVQRNLQLARHLPSHGFRPIVITGPGGAAFRWTPPDAALERTLDASVHRLPPPEPSYDASWDTKLERWLRVSGRWRRWWSANVVAAAAAFDERVDLVHASIAPYGTAEGALEVARRLRKPLVVDLEDPWALDEMLVYPTRLHRALEIRRMGRLLLSATRVVMNTHEARRRVLEVFPDLPPERVAAIPNAFDPDDFRAVVPSRSDRAFRVVHTGSLHTDLGLEQRSAGRLRRVLGGTFPGVDFLPRSHVYLLEAVQRLRQERPELGGAVEVHLAGVFTTEDRAVASRFDFVHLHDFLPHDETIALMRSADVLFLPMHDLPPGVRAGLVPHKTYEYLASGRPILAAVPAGDARDLLERSGAAVLCDPSDVDAIAAALRRDVEAWQEGASPRTPDAAVVAQCASDRLVRDLASLYQTVYAESASRPNEG